MEPFKSRVFILGLFDGGFQLWALNFTRAPSLFTT